MPARAATTVKGEVYATPQFNLGSPVPLTATGTSRRSIVVGEPGFVLTVYGTGFTPATQLGINGFIRASTVVDANRITVALTPSDYAAPGEVLVQSLNRDAASCQILDATFVPVRAAGYAWPATTDVVEYYNAALDHYFITANADEMAKLDNGTFVGWRRTGQSFKSYPADSSALATDLASAVCRFYGNPAAGLDSHFYSAAKDECDAVRQKFPDAWVYESGDVFQAIVPDKTTGACPEGSAPVYRLWNQRADVNHRYTTDAAIRTQMIGRGYVPEGYGPLGVAMCAPV
jgi:hypothetical protein